MGTNTEVKLIRASDLQTSVDTMPIFQRLEYENLDADDELSIFAIGHSVRRVLPYGIWTTADGREVVFNREYQPILQRINGVNSHANPREWITDIVKKVYLYDDNTNPFDFIKNKLESSKLSASHKRACKKSLAICLDVIKQYSPDESMSTSRAYSVVQKL